nr:hypothetical protein [Tanacetum cinerariifolium]
MDLSVGNKMHKAFPLPAIKFPLTEELPTASEDGSYFQKKRDATTRKIALLSKTRRNYQSKKDGSYTKRITFNTHLTFTFNSKQDMDQHYPTVAKIPVIEFGDSYEVPANDPSTTTINTTSGEAGMKSGRMVTLTTEDMQKKKNDVKARTTLLLSLLDEHQLRFSKYKTTRELWAAILKTFGGNEATKKTKKNLLKQQSDLDTMSLDDLYNYLKVYEIEVQKKMEPNTQSMAFISSAKHSRGNDEVNTASVYTASNNVPTAGANVATVSINQETACAYIASQSSGSQI